jgi:hypothetical protein
MNNKVKCKKHELIPLTTRYRIITKWSSRDQFHYIAIQKFNIGTWSLVASRFTLTKPSRWWSNGKSLGPEGLLPLWSQVRALWLLI